ncbi:restriction endonuclease subunit S [Tolypothrix sp. FACHB-123]|uniref:restriction endonuclease subunit S n=1 Tax=Tolypothrix sp. FACHB-123 TaxID=2692868 RepID=UPI00168349C9|nr:restriction endonuclease subunit S [Tolypothrix sp. FACHB-123]MBD2353770.1 restriction endonuclease subunit S [Tolypothrix sp. FACHB-123]
MNFSPVKNIPEDWNIVELQTTGEVIYGIQASVANNTEPIGTKIITNKNISLDGKLIFEKQSYFEIKTASHRKTLLIKGDILFNWRSGSQEHVGKTAYFDIDGEYTHSSFILRIRPNKSIINGKFLYYYLYWLRESKYFIKAHSYAINAKFNKSAVNSLPTLLPPLEEQQKISVVLSIVQDAITQQEKLITLSTELKKSLMHKLFTEGTRGEQQKMTKIGLIPESWKIVPLGDLISFGPNNGLYKHQSEYGSGTLVLRIDDFSNDGDIVDNAANRLNTDNNDKEKYGLVKNDIVLNRVNSLSHLGKTALIGELQEPMVFESNMMRFRVNESMILPKFAFYILNSSSIKVQIIGSAKRAVAQASINQGDVKNLLFPLPDLCVQSELVSITTQLSQKIAIYQDRVKIFKNLFLTLLQQLMTAQIRADDLNLSALNLEMQGRDE